MTFSGRFWMEKRKDVEVVMELTRYECVLIPHGESAKCLGLVTTH